MNKTIRMIKKAIMIIPLKFKSILIKLLLYIFIGSILEMFGIGLIFPLINKLNQKNQDIVPHNQFILKFSNFLGIDIVILVYLLFLLAIIFIFFIKSFFQAFLFKRQAYVSFSIQKELSKDLLKKYLNKPYSFFKTTNSSIIIRNITVEVNEFSLNVLLPSLYLVTEILITISILTILIFIEPIGTFLILILSLLSIIFYKLKSKKSLKIEGGNRQKSESKRFKIVQEAINSIKEIKLYSKENFFINYYNDPNEISANAGMYLTTTIQIPRLLFETTGIISICILIFLNILKGIPIEHTMAVVGVLAAASFRLMPSITRITNSLQSIKYSIPVINQIYEAQQILENKQQNETNQISNIKFKNKYTLNDISYKHEGKDDYFFKNLNFEFTKGDYIGIIGQSGAGKSTLIELLLGLIEPNSGEILIDEKIMTPLILKNNIKFGYVQQSPQLFEGTLLENITFNDKMEEIDNNLFHEALVVAELDSFILSKNERVLFNVGENGNNLSGGEKQRVGIARALYRKPEILILDESTSALDKETENQILKKLFLLSDKMTIIFISHKYEALKNCNKIYKIDSGKLIDAIN